MLRKAKLLFSPTALSQAAALAAFEDEAYLEETLDKIAAGRTRLADGLAVLGLSPLPTAANIVSAELPCDAAEVVKALADRDILTRDWRDPGHPRHIRITVGLLWPISRDPDSTTSASASRTKESPSAPRFPIAASALLLILVVSWLVRKFEILMGADVRTGVTTSG